MQVGQRTATAIVTLTIMVLAILVGGPENLPRSLSTESIMAVIAPGGLVLATLFNTFGAINARVGEGKLKPGDLLALGATREFWISVVAAIAGGLQLSGETVINETNQTFIVDLLLLGTAGLTRTWGMRPSGTEALTVTITPIAQ